MPETQLIRPSDLLIDEMNPRLAEPNEGQRAAQRAIAADQQKKLQVLAKDIVEYGLNPLKPPIVMQSEGGRFIVIEGNRRLTALKALENPDLLANAVSASVLREIRRLSKRYHDEGPIDQVECIVIHERDEVDHWLELEHTGWNDGAGIVNWGADEAARFKARSGLKPPPPQSQVLDYLSKRGDLTPEKRKTIKTTNLQRLLQQPQFRDHVGLGLKNQKLYLRADEDKVARALMYVIDNLPPVTKIHSKEQRIKFAQDLPSRIRVKPTVEDGEGPAIMSVEATADGSAAKKKVARPLKKQRDRLIPNDCTLNITDSRVLDIEVELRTLNVHKFTNAVSVLLRVFIELSVDCYISNAPLPLEVTDSLAKKMQNVAHDLVKKKRLTTQQAKPVNKAVSDTSFLGPSVKLMHDYVHNVHHFPAPGDLIAHWNSLQPFIAAMWTV